MIEERARVIGVDGDAVLVESERTSICGGCSVNKVCGSGVIAKAYGNKVISMKVINSVNAGVGDNVTIGIDDRMLVKASFAAYLIPLLMLLAGAWSGQLLGESIDSAASAEGFSIVAGMLGLAIGYVWLRRYSLKLDGDQSSRPTTVRNNSDHNHSCDLS